MKAAIFLFSLMSFVCFSQPRSSFDDMSPELQALQNDDASNPAMLFVKAGELEFKAHCASCHSSMQGVSIAYPKAITLEQQISNCASERVQKPLNLLHLESYIALQSRGLLMVADKISVRGEAFFKQKQGQLNLSCADCHDKQVGRKLFDAVIPYGASNGYPQYRLEWQALGGLKRRINNCLNGVRASFPSPDTYYELEVYLKQRSHGLKSEAPAIRP